MGMGIRPKEENANERKWSRISTYLGLSLTLFPYQSEAFWFSNFLVHFFAHANISHSRSLIDKRGRLAPACLSLLTMAALGNLDYLSTSLTSTSFVDHLLRKLSPSRSLFDNFLFFFQLSSVTVRRSGDNNANDSWIYRLFASTFKSETKKKQFFFMIINRIFTSIHGVLLFFFRAL